MTDSKTQKSLYTPTDVKLAIPEFKNDFISLQQDESSVTDHDDNEWHRTGATAGSTAQTLIQAANKGLWLQLTSGGDDPEDDGYQVRVPKSGVYKAVYSAQVAFTLGEGEDDLDVELGIGQSDTEGTPPAIVHKVPAERAVRVQAPPGTSSGTIVEHVTGSVILRLSNEDVLRFYDRVLNDVVDVTILNADIHITRLDRDGQ